MDHRLYTPHQASAARDAWVSLASARSPRRGSRIRHRGNTGSAARTRADAAAPLASALRRGPSAHGCRHGLYRDPPLRLRHHCRRHGPRCGCEPQRPHAQDEVADGRDAGRVSARDTSHTCLHPAGHHIQTHQGDSRGVWIFRHELFRQVLQIIARSHPGSLSQDPQPVIKNPPHLFQ